MNKALPIILLFLGLNSQFLQAQNYYFPFSSLTEMACPFDSASTVFMSSNYRYYSTLDDNYWGEMDSSLCYTLNETNGSFQTSQVPSGRKLFAEFILTDSLPLQPHLANRIYGLFQDWSGLGCDSIGCKKVILETWVPDSSGLGEIVRPRILDFDDGYYYGDIQCFATEKFTDQYIRRVIFEYDTPDDIEVWFNSPWMEPASGQVLLSTPFSFWEWNQVTIVPQHDSIYPTQDSISYSEFIPFTNPTDSQNLEIYVDPYSTLLFEPHTGLRGGLVEGSDTVRHSITLVDQGMMCLPVVEVFWEGDNKIIIDNGIIDLQHEMACFVVGNGGTMQINSGTSLDYGKFGRGMLILKPDANIVIEPGAELRLGCTVHMYEYENSPEDAELIIDLVKGAKLTFTSSAKLSNEYSRGQNMKMKVRMLGGELDDSALSDDEKSLIERIYAEPDKRFQNNLEIFPNPVSNVLEFSWVASKPDKTVQFEVIDMSGKLMLNNSTSTFNEGHNFYNLNVHDLEAGIYLLRFIEEGAATSKPFVKH